MAPEIKDVTDEEDEMIKKVYASFEKRFIKVGAAGHIMPGAFRDICDDILKMEVRHDDVWIVTYPRSGTTWIQEMTWLLCNGLDYATAVSVPLTRRFFFVELHAFVPEKEADAFPVSNHLKMSATADARRFIKTHLPLSLLPTDLFNKNAKIVYVARDPRDVCVSYFYHQKWMHGEFMRGDLKTFWELFRRDLTFGSSPIAHAVEAWDKRGHPNLKFIFYEDMKTDLLSVVKEMSSFLDQQYSAEQLTRLVQHLGFDAMKANKAVNLSLDADVRKFTRDIGDQQFIRRGEVGGWRGYFDHEMERQAAEYLEERLAETDMRYPTF